MKNAEVTPAVRLLIQSGILPVNTLQQLKGWRLLPEDCVKSHGSQPVTLESEWGTVKEFVDSLDAAIKQEASTIRETELDRIGKFVPCQLIIEGEEPFRTSVFVDRLGHVILPGELKYEQTKHVHFYDKLHEVSRVESRYQGERLVAWVCYL